MGATGGCTRIWLFGPYLSPGRLCTPTLFRPTILPSRSFYFLPVKGKKTASLPQGSVRSRLLQLGGAVVEERDNPELKLATYCLRYGFCYGCLLLEKTDIEP
jgi:hypothetical protein